MTEKPPFLTRRKVVGAGALAVIGVVALRSFWKNVWLANADLGFEDMPDPPGYRILRGRSTIPGGVPLFGLDKEKPAGLLTAQAKVDADLTSMLFDPATGDGTVPIAYFFDYQCPICRLLTPRLRLLENVQITWHDLTGLGPASVLAARASIAAGFQGAYDQFHDRLMRARFQATDGYVSALAESVDIDPEQLLRDMQSDAVTRRMWRARAVADRFGMVGTPGLVIGHSVVIGNISLGDLRRIVASEPDAV